MFVERKVPGGNENNWPGNGSRCEVVSPSELSEKEQVLEALRSLFETQAAMDVLKGYGVVPVFNDEFSVFCFGTEAGDRIIAVSLRNVRRAIWRGRIFTGEELADRARCVGIFVPDMDKIAKKIEGDLSPEERREKAKAEAYRQGREVLRELRERYNLPSQSRVGLAVATLGQARIWEKFGFAEELAPGIEGAPSFAEILNALVYNSKGGLRDIEVSVMPRPAGVPEIDLVFYQRDKNGLARPCGVTLWGWGKNLKEPAVYGNVVGLVGVPEEMPLGERKVLARKLASLYNRWLNIREGIILVVDQNLVNWWKENGPLVKREDWEAAKNQPLKRRVDYGISKGGEPKEARLVLFGDPSIVGGPQMLVDLGLGDGIFKALIVDFGFPPVDRALREIGGRPSLEAGLTPWLEAGFLPPVRRLYRLDMLMKSLTEEMIGRALEGRVGFVMGELYHRLGREGLQGLMEINFSRLDFKRTEWQTFWDNLEKHEKDFYGSKRFFDEALLTHSHTDHTGGVWAIRPEVPAGISPETFALLMARFHYVGEIEGETLIQRGRRETAPYPLLERPIHLYNLPSRWEEVGDQFSVFALPVNHSVPGILAFVIAVGREDNFRLRIAYLTDFREGPQTQAAVETIREIGPEVLIIEGTNIGEDKPSEGVTEEKVKETIRRIIGENSGRYVIIQMPVNNLERLANIIGVAKESGRRVAIPLALAQILHEFGILNDRLPRGKELEVPQIGEELVVYYQPKAKYEGWETHLMELYGAVSVGEVLGKPGDFAVIFPSSMLLGAVFSGNVKEGVGGVFIYSNYWPYDGRQKGGVKSNFRFAQSQGWQVVSDVAEGLRIIRPRGSGVWGVHASGHAPEEHLLEVIRKIAEGGLRMVVPIHTEHRRIFAEGIRKALGEVLVYPQVPGVRVVGRLGKRRAEIPLPLR